MSKANVRRRTKRSVTVPRAILYQGLSSRAVHLYLALRDHADARGRSWPSQQHLAELLRCSDRSIRRALRELEDAGLIQARARARENGAQTSSEYVLPAIHTPPANVSGTPANVSTPPANVSTPPANVSTHEEGIDILQVGGSTNALTVQVPTVGASTNALTSQALTPVLQVSDSTNALTYQPLEIARTLFADAREIDGSRGDVTTDGDLAGETPASGDSEPKIDPIFEALFTLETGEPYSPQARGWLTKKAAAALNAAAGEIRATGISPEDLRAAIAAWPHVMPPGTTCTAHAVAKHLPRLRAAANGTIFAMSEVERVAAEARRIAAAWARERT